MKKYRNNKLPNIFSNYFKAVQNYHSYETGLSKAQNYFFQRTIKKLGQKQIGNVGSKTWQTIPPTLKDG